MRYRLSTLLLIVAFAAIATSLSINYFNKADDIVLLIEHMETLPKPCSYRQFELLAKKLQFNLTPVLSNDNWTIWEIERDDDSSTPRYLHTEFRIVNSNGKFLLGESRILDRQYSGGAQIWPYPPKQQNARQ